MGALLAVTAATTSAEEVPGTALTAGPRAPVRLVHGPTVFRLRGYRDAPRSSAERQYRYALVLKLSGDPRVVYRGDDGGRSRTDGTYQVKGHPADEAFFGLGAKEMHCYVGYVEDRGGPPRDDLNAIRIGRRVATTVRLTAGVTEDQTAPRHGRTYRRRVVMRSGDVHLRSDAVRRQLARIGC